MIEWTAITGASQARRRERSAHRLRARPRLCDGLTGREVLRAGGLTALGLSLPDLLRGAGAAQATARRGGKARSCIVLFLMGGPPQHST
jgi:hypothetical protein